MEPRNTSDNQDIVRLGIASAVRELRQARRWTQRDLARELGLSQSRLSEIENGKGSFTAEQCVRILEVFHATIEDLVPARGPAETDLELQNALAQLGARHLREAPVVRPRSTRPDLREVVREALLSGSPRLITALAPVLLTNIDRLRLEELDARLTDAGLHRRLAWLVENTLQAVHALRPSEPRREVVRQYRRAELVFDHYLALAHDREPTRRGPPPDDLLDADIRTPRTLTIVKKERSPISRRWGILTTIQPADFVDAVKQAHVDH